MDLRDGKRLSERGDSRQEEEMEEQTSKEKESVEDFMKKMLEVINKNNETMNKNIEDLKQNQELTNKTIKDLERNLEFKLEEKLEQNTRKITKEIEDIQNRMDSNNIQMRIEFEESIRKMEDKWENKNNKLETRIEETESITKIQLQEMQDMKLEITNNIEVSKEENVRKERRIIDELERRIMEAEMKMSFNISNDDMINKIKLEHEEMKRERIRLIEEMNRIKEENKGSIILTTCGSENNVKFDGDIRKMHPKVFMKILRSKLSKVREVIDIKEMIRNSLSGQALIWFSSQETNINNIDEFEVLFIEYFWGSVSQFMVREKLHFGKYDENRNTPAHLYAMQIYSQTQYLEPRVTEEEAVILLSRHYKFEIMEAVTTQNINTMEKLISYLKRFEHLYTKYNNNKQNNNNNYRYSNTNNRNNRINNTDRNNQVNYYNPSQSNQQNNNYTRRVNFQRSSFLDNDRRMEQNRHKKPDLGNDPENVINPSGDGDSSVESSQYFM